MTEQKQKKLVNITPHRFIGAEIKVLDNRLPAIKFALSMQ